MPSNGFQNISVDLSVCFCGTQDGKGLLFIGKFWVKTLSLSEVHVLIQCQSQDCVGHWSRVNGEVKCLTMSKSGQLSSQDRCGKIQVQSLVVKLSHQVGVWGKFDLIFAHLGQTGYYFYPFMAAWVLNKRTGVFFPHLEDDVKFSQRLIDWLWESCLFVDQYCFIFQNSLDMALRSWQIQSVLAP